MLLVTSVPLAVFCQQKEIIARIDSLVAIAHYDEAKNLVQIALQSADGRTYSLLSNRSAEISIAQGKLDIAENELKNIKTNNDPFYRSHHEDQLWILIS